MTHGVQLSVPFLSVESAGNIYKVSSFDLILEGVLFLTMWLAQTSVQVCMAIINYSICTNNQLLIFCFSSNNNRWWWRWWWWWWPYHWRRWWRSIASKYTYLPVFFIGFWDKYKILKLSGGDYITYRVLCKILIQKKLILKNGNIYIEKQENSMKAHTGRDTD